MINISTKSYLPHQKKFFFSKSSVKALVSGFGAGKTHIFIRETLKHYLTNRNPKTDRSRGWIIYPTLGLAEELFVEPFEALLDQAGIKYKYNKSKMTFYSIYGTIRIFSLQTPKRFIGSELTFCGFDEFDVESVQNCSLAFKKAIGRMRGNDHTCLYIVTTPEGFKETYRIFQEEKKGELIKARTTDNPFLPKEYISELRTQYDEKLLRQYLEGEFVNLTGMQALYSFDREKNIIKKIDKKEIPINLIIGMDFNVSPFTATINFISKWSDVSYDKNGNIISPTPQQMTTFDERFIVSTGGCGSFATYTHKMMASILDEYPNEYWKRINKNDPEIQSKPTYNIVICPDMSGKTGQGKRQTSASMTDINILREHEVKIKGLRNPPVKDRLTSSNTALYFKKWVITENCKNLISDIEKVIVDEYGNLDKSNQMMAQIIDAGTYAIYRYFPVKSHYKPIVK